ncbi:hypothetical protein, partial [Mesorhizobium sp.]|uniref:hypothetical protein n=1 Tax=Mesorhizobium sp. TaxID=1871066 RepID=UPI0025BB2D5D
SGAFSSSPAFALTYPQTDVDSVARQPAIFKITTVGDPLRPGGSAFGPVTGSGSDDASETGNGSES